MSILLQGGRVVDVATSLDRVMDVLIDNGRMVAFGSEARAMPHQQVQNVSGCLILPALTKAFAVVCMVASNFSCS